MPAKGIQLFEELMRFRPEGLTANGWAVKAGVGRNFWNDLKRHGNPSRRTLEKLLAAADSSLAEFEALRIGRQAAGAATEPAQLHETRRTWPSSQSLQLPLLGSAFGGEWQAGSGIGLTEILWGERRGSLARPASLASDPNAYAVTIVDDSMWPRFRPGRRIAVSPAASVTIGDDVLVVLRRRAGADNALALVKELVRRTSTMIELRQFSPDISFPVEERDIEAIHRVAGELF